MGIPHLISRLQPYAISSSLGCRNSDCLEHRSHTSRRITIDGPGLAYHVYYSLLAYKSSYLNSFDAVPSYAEIGQGAIKYLEGLEAYGLTMYGSLSLIIRVWINIW